MLYNKYSDFITVQTKIESKSRFFSHSLSLDFFLHVLSFYSIGDDWNLVMEH